MVFHRLSFFLLAPFLLVCKAQENATSAPTVAPDVWGGCQYDPNAKVTIGDPTTICFNVADGVDWGEKVSYLRLNFEPAADEYSRFHVPGCT
jgi:hypothetical protein